LIRLNQIRSDQINYNIRSEKIRSDQIR